MPSRADPLIAHFEHIRASTYLSETAGALYELKLAFSDDHSAARAAALFSGWLDSSVGRDSELPIIMLNQYCEQYALEFHEYSPERRETINSPIIYGKAPESRIEVHSRRIYSALIENCLIVGRSSLIRVAGGLIADHTKEELEALPVDFRFDPLVFRQSGNLLTIAAIENPALELHEAISLVGVTSCAFGHMMMEFLPKYFLLRHQRIAAGVPILIDAGMPPQHREALEIHAAGANPIIEVPAFAAVRVERLWVASTTCFIPIMPQMGADLGPTYLSPPPETIATLFGERNHALPPALASSTGGRIFLARRMSQHRRMVNHTEIVDLCESCGFKIIYPEDFSFKKQLEIIRGAAFIIAPEGSALMTVMHALPGTNLLILNHPFLENLPALTSSLECLGLNVQILEGECVRLDPFARKFSDYKICQNDVRSILREWNIGT